MRRILVTAAAVGLLSGTAFAQDNTRDLAGSIDQLTGIQAEVAELLIDYGVEESEISQLTVGDLINIYVVLQSDLDDRAKEFQIASIFQNRGM